MTARLTGDISELRAARSRLSMLHESLGLLTCLGYAAEAAKVQDEAVILTGTEFAVPVPCILCEKPVNCTVIVGDRGCPEPSVVLCGECNARTEAEVRAELKGGS
jgi:hypothetical protein